MAAPLDTPVYLEARESLRIADGAGFEVKCLRGNLWITQHGDLEDSMIGRGESFVRLSPHWATRPWSSCSRAPSLCGSRSGTRPECHGAR